MLVDPSRMILSRRQALKSVGTTFAAIGTGASVSTASTDNLESPETASIAVKDQSPHHGTVYVADVTLPEDGFVALHDASFLLEGPVVGISAPLAKGRYFNLPIEFDEYPDRPLPVAAIAHRDTPSDGVFTFPDDGDTVFLTDGGVVHDTARIKLE